MNKIIKIDGINNFFLDIDNKCILKYDKKIVESLSLKLEDGSLLTVDKDRIKFENGQVVFEFNNDKYIVDDGYQDLLIRAGYIVMDDYDVENIEDKDFGAEDFGDEEYGVGMRKGDTKLVEAFNKAYEELKTEGTLAEISTKWFGEDITC